MAVNLVHQFGRARSRELLEQSFAQFQADKAVVGLARQVHKAEEALDGYREAATCHLGDFMEYAALRRRISDLEKGAARERRQDRRGEAAASLGKLRPGDVIQVPAGKFSGLAVVIDPGHSGDEPRPYVVTADRQARRLAMMDFPVPVEAIGRLRIPKSFNGRNPAQRRDLANALRARADSSTRPHRGVRRSGTRSATRPPTARSAGCAPSSSRTRATSAPTARTTRGGPSGGSSCSATPRRSSARGEPHQHRRAHLRPGLRRAHRAGLPRRRQGHRAGRHLRRIYTDMDLVAAEAIRAGLFDELAPSELAAVLSALVFEARRADDASSPKLPGAGSSRPSPSSSGSGAQLDALERDHKLDFLREPDLGFAWAAWRWAEGDDLDDVLMVTGLSAGDFVRWMKQLLDLCGQVADAAGDSPLRATARAPAGPCKRGVVAYSVLAE